MTKEQNEHLKKTTKIEFIKKYWFEPKYIVDRLALIGDNSDNIPGIKWIWEKIATELIKKYKTIENIYNHLDEIPEKIRKKLVEWKEKVFKSKQLIKLLKIPWIDNYCLNDFSLNINSEKLYNVLVSQYGFKSFEKTLKELKSLYNTKQISLF